MRRGVGVEQWSTVEDFTTHTHTHTRTLGYTLQLPQHFLHLLTEILSEVSLLPLFCCQQRLHFLEPKSKWTIQPVAKTAI